MSGPPDAFEQALLGSPALFAQGYDPLHDRALILELTPDVLREAAFLDDRLVRPGIRGQWIAAEPLTALMAQALRPACRFVFHIGHCGSTLLSRMIGAIDGVLSLREPQALRTFAELALDRDSPESIVAPAMLDARLATFVRLWSRPLAAGGVTVVKPTSFVSELAPALLALTGQPALAMSLAAEPYLAGILGGPESTEDVLASAQGRLRRLHRRLGATPWRLATLSPGERIAMSWASERTALAAAAGPLLMPVDFDAFLADPAAGLAAALAHLGIACPDGIAAAIATGPLLRRYSKAPGEAYSPALRAEVLAAARRDESAELAAGLRWLEAAARDWPAIAAVMSR